MAKKKKNEGDESDGKAGAGLSRGKFDFMGSRKSGYILSVLVILVSLGALGTKGLNWGIDFRGGSIYRYRFPDAAKATALAVQKIVETTLPDEMSDSVQIQAIAKSEEVQDDAAAPTGGAEAAAGSDNDVEYLIFTGFSEKDARDDAMPKVEARFKNELGGYTRLSATEVGPTIGGQIKAAALKALLLAVAGMLFYIALRFEFRWGLASVLALVHDCLIVLGVFAIFQREVTSDSLAALLTIIGYSLNDTIVIIDRVRENLGSHQLKRRLGYEGVVNLSVNQSLARTLNTSVTTLFPVVCLLLFGGLAIRDFALALFVGVIAGTYSSIFVVSSVLVDWYYRDHPGLVEKDRAKAAAAE